jgi:hypothetical protein
MRKNNSKIKGAKSIARLLFERAGFLETYLTPKTLKQLRFLNRTLLRYATGLQTPIK